MKKTSLAFPILFFLSLTVTVILLTGCNNIKESPIVTIGGKALYRKDFIYDIYLIEKEGNTQGEYYINNYGCNYWDYSYGGTTLREVAKNSLMASVVMHEILSQQAQITGLALTDQETLNCKNTVNALLESDAKEELLQDGLSKQVITDIFLKTALSDKYSEKLMTDFPIDEEKIKSDLSQEDFREYKTDCLYITSSGNADREITFEKALKLKEMAETGTTFQSLVKEDNELKYYSRDFIYGNSSFDESYQNAAVILKNGECSEVISTRFGYYIIHMLDNNSSDRYEEAVKEAITKEKNRMFEEAYNKIKDKYEININFKYWDTIKIGNITIDK